MNPFRWRVPHPIFRKLRVFAIDPGITAHPGITAQFGTAVMSRLAIPWESLQPGPVGEYLEVIDRGPSGEPELTPPCLWARLTPFYWPGVRRGRAVTLRDPR